MKSFANKNQVHRVTLYFSEGSPIATIWAAIEKGSGDKNITHKITTRYSPEYANADFIRFGIRKFEVFGYAPTGSKDQYLTFEVEEIL